MKKYAKKDLKKPKWPQNLPVTPKFSSRVLNDEKNAKIWPKASKRDLRYRYIEMMSKNSKATWTETTKPVQGIYQKGGEKTPLLITETSFFAKKPNIHMQLEILGIFPPSLETAGQGTQNQICNVSANFPQKTSF